MGRAPKLEISYLLANADSIHSTCSSSSYNAPCFRETSVSTKELASTKPRYQCSICFRSFSEKGNLNKHVRSIHEGHRPHRCLSCSRSFAFQDGLKRHIAMRHLNSRPWECHECVCGSRGNTKSHKCMKVCGMKFKQKSHLLRHIKSVHA